MSGSAEGILALCRVMLQDGRAEQALPLLQEIVLAKPRSAEARLLQGRAAQLCGDVAKGEAAFRAGIRLDGSNAALTIALADLLEAAERLPEAETALRAALALNRRSPELTLRIGEVLLALGRPRDAAQITARLAAGAAPEHALLALRANAFKALGEIDKALAVYRRAAALFADSAVAHHNLSATLGDVGQFAEAEASAGRAFAKGGRARPQTWLVYARALLGQSRLDASENAFREAIARAPAYVDAHRDLAQLVWMRGEDVRAATSSLDEAIAAQPTVLQLLELRANILHHAGDIDGAHTTLREAAKQHPGSAALQTGASRMAALAGDEISALLHAEAAAALAPEDDNALDALFVACAAIGDAVRAKAIADRMVAARPLDQKAIAYRATAWRLLGDPRYEALHDYGSLVRAWMLDVPPGWSTLESYLADLADGLDGVHAFRTHPLDQSLRHGSQAPNLRTSTHPAIQAFFPAVDGPIRRHLAESRGARNADYSFQGVWSVKLRPGGFHTDHVHPNGILSSACYIKLPESGGEDDPRAAWIKFGEPGIPTKPALAAEHFVEPAPGMLVLFPSYMWHGTVPFAGDAPRLSIAFDLR